MGPKQILEGILMYTTLGHIGVFFVVQLNGSLVRLVAHLLLIRCRIENYNPVLIL